MAIKSILGFAFSASEDDAVVRALDVLSTRFNAHATCVLAGVIPLTSIVGLDGYVGVVGVDVMQYVTDLLKKEEVLLKAALRRSENDTDIATMETFDGNFEYSAALRSRYADLSVVRRPDQVDTAPRSKLIDALLMNSGRPVLVVPPDWRAPELGKKVLLAWDASKEAGRALYDALGLIAPGAEVVVVTVNADEDKDRFGEVPGRDIALYLARHGFRTSVRNETSHEGGVASIVLAQAHEIGADLIVIGAYRHSRMRQAIFGGTTHTLLSKADVPLLLAH